MIDDWHTIHQIVHASHPNAKFDVEISLNPKKHAFAGPDDLVAKMKYINQKLSPHGFWFDFHSDAPSSWVQAAIKYAHSQNQTVGGNIFNSQIPAGTDAFAFVDKNVTNTTNPPFGFDFNPTQISKLKAAASKLNPEPVILGHVQSNAQNGDVDTNFSYVYTQLWTDEKRERYLEYWAEQQCKLGFTFEWPVFYPLYPDVAACDPLTDVGTDGRCLFDEIGGLIEKYPGCQ